MVVGIEVSQDATLRVQKKRIHTMTLSKVANVIRNHAVQPPGSVRA